MRTYPRLHAGALLACGLVFLLSPSRTNAAANAGIIEHPDRPEDAYVSTYQAMLGKGYNTFTATQRGDCVNLPFVPPASEGYDSHARISVIQSSEDLKRETSIEVSGSAGFGMATVEASASFSSSMHFSANSDYLLIRVTATGPSVGGGAGQLGSDAAKFKANSQEFFKMCGNRYISEIKLGGEFLALLEFTASNEADRKDVQAHLKAASGLNSVSSDLKTQIEQAQSKSSMHMTITRRGTTDPFPDTTIDKLIAYAQEFPSKLSIKTVVPVGIVVADYQTIDPNISSIEEQPEVGRLRQNMQAVSKELAGIDDLLGAYRRLGIVGRSVGLQSIQQTLEPMPAAMQEALDACGKAPWSAACKFPAAMLNLQLPPLPMLPSRVTFSVLGGESQVGMLERGQQATLVVSGRFIYNGDDGGQADVAGSTQVVLVGENGVRKTFMYGDGKPAQVIKGPVSVSVVLIDSYYADNREVSTPTALLY